MLYDGDGRKIPKYTKTNVKTKEKIPRLVALPSPRLNFLLPVPYIPTKLHFNVAKITQL